VSIPLSIGVYFIIWWTVLFAVLPLGVRTQAEDGEIVRGTPESAPTHPRLLRIVTITTGLSAVVFVLVYVGVSWGIVDLDALRIAARKAPG
jgi:predicted secreted protein